MFLAVCSLCGLKIIFLVDGTLGRVRLIRQMYRYISVSLDPRPVTTIRQWPPVGPKSH